MKRFLKAITLTLALAMLPVLALADGAFGSAAVNEGRTYTLEDMLTYALQDEYMAKTEYEAIQAAFGVNNPYANIMRAEMTHQELLLPLFETYGFPVPADTSADHVVIPATLPESYQLGVEAEIANIAMYQAFLKQDNVPQDVRSAFDDLIRASQSHLEAFTRNAEKPGTGLGNGQENGRNQKQTEELAAGFGQGNGSNSADTQMGGRGNRTAGTQMSNSGTGRRNETVNNAETCDDCNSVSTDQSQQPRGGRNRN